MRTIEMKRALEQASVCSQRVASVVWNPSEIPLRRAATLVTPPALGAGPIGSIWCDHLNVLHGNSGIERITVVCHVVDDARRGLPGDQEVEPSLR